MTEGRNRARSCLGSRQIATEEKVFAVVAFLTSSRAPPRRVSRASNMPKKRQTRPGKPFIEWCAENGKRGERLANEFREELPTELTRGSEYKAKWKCLKCKHVWRARVCNRTRSDKPRGCPKCANHMPLSKTNNFLAWCEKNGELGKKLSREYVDKDKPPTAVTKASKYKALWKCEECKHVWRAQMFSRTNSDRPTGCPTCFTTRGRRPGKRQRVK